MILQDLLYVGTMHIFVNLLYFKVDFVSVVNVRLDHDQLHQYENLQNQQRLHIEMQKATLAHDDQLDQHDYWYHVNQVSEAKEPIQETLFNCVVFVYELEPNAKEKFNNYPQGNNTRVYF